MNSVGMKHSSGLVPAGNGRPVLEDGRPLGEEWYEKLFEAMKEAYGPGVHHASDMLAEAEAWREDLPPSNLKSGSASHKQHR